MAHKRCVVFSNGIEIDSKYFVPVWGVFARRPLVPSDFPGQYAEHGVVRHGPINGARGGGAPTHGHQGHVWLNALKLLHKKTNACMKY